MREVKGWNAVPYQWATAGYSGAIGSGRTICGILFGAAVYLGYLSGVDATGVPEVKDERRKKAIASVNHVFQGFKEKFGDTDCKTLTGCDWSKKEDIKRYRNEKIYKNTCYPQFEYVLAELIQK
ncbi:MAG: C_GCAxxG_C_C family protein [Deltaproteobacteria bacterium]|jgi:hypothetical protein|nr:C_GCAxxG_C_C family protein [Deltaproteobacteria bacterium]